MMRLLRRGALALALVLAMLTMQTGCGRVKRAPVSGRVTYNGKPVKTGQIVFLGPDGYSAVSELDGDGSYRLRAAVGENTVTVESRGLGTPVARLGPEGGPGFLKMAPGRPLTPERYVSPTNSGLRFKVRSGANTADFDLKD